MKKNFSHPEIPKKIPKIEIANRKFSKKLPKKKSPAEKLQKKKSPAEKIPKKIPKIEIASRKASKKKNR